MAESHLVSGLKTLRAEKLGDLQTIKEDIERLEAEAERVEGVIGHIDGVLKEVAPGEDLAAIKPVRSRRSKEKTPRQNKEKDEMPVSQHVLRILRQEGIPMKSDEIIECLMTQRPGAVRTKVANAARNFLTLKTKEGLLHREMGTDDIGRYSIRH